MIGHDKPAARQPLGRANGERALLLRNGFELGLSSAIVGRAAMGHDTREAWAEPPPDLDQQRVSAATPAR